MSFEGSSVNQGGSDLIFVFIGSIRLMDGQPSAELPHFVQFRLMFAILGLFAGGRG